MKKIILSLLVFIGLIFGYSLVLADLTNTPLKIKPLFKSGNNIFLDSKDLDFIIVSFESNKDISNYNLFSVCNTESSFLNSFNNQYFFKIKYISNSCSNPNIVLKDNLGKVAFGSFIKLRLINDRDLYNTLLDYSDSDLALFSYKMGENVKKYSIFSKYERGISEKTFTFLLKNRIYKEYSYNSMVAKNILNNRKNKYISPVLNYKLSTSYSKLPNAGRGYREGYTDGIHHGWDVDAPYATDVVALDSGLILRVVDGFLPSDLNKIKKTSSLTYLEELHNLDLLRGNQIWLKTMKGELIFYSHLSEIFDNVKEGTMVEKGELLGKIGISGIPGNTYTDYHLHFVIHENPYYKHKAGKYSFDDYMSWNWKFKGETASYILKNISAVFE